MKHIVKQAEPDTFARWKESDKMAKRPNWNRVPGDVKRDVRSALMREQGFLCCYCEALVDGEGSHVEHYRPRTTPGIATDSSTTRTCIARADGIWFAGNPGSAGSAKAIGSTSSFWSRHWMPIARVDSASRAMAGSIPRLVIDPHRRRSSGLPSICRNSTSDGRRYCTAMSTSRSTTCKRSSRHRIRKGVSFRSTLR